MGYISSIEAYYQLIGNLENREKFIQLIEWVSNHFDLTLEIKYNQPMFTMNGTFILAISALKNHISFAPEVKTMQIFHDDFKQANIEQTSHLFKIKYNDVIDYELLKRVIEFNMKDKKGYPKFWRV